VFTPDDAYERIRAGATLVQLYTGLIYEGPRAVSQIVRGLAERLERDGFTNVSEAVGADVR
jgi:dihydroorotate dehydrogenase